jgi:hypothetical protein
MHGAEVTTLPGFSMFLRLDLCTWFGWKLVAIVTFVYLQFLKGNWLQ